MYRSDTVMIVFISATLAISLAGFAFCSGVDSACLRHGYPDSKIDLRFRGYCIKRVNQTDVVTPLKELEP